MLQKFEFDYDGENDNLFLFDRKRKSNRSVSYGKNITFDLTNRNEFAGLEFRDARKVLGNLAKRDFSRKDLEQVSKAKLQVEQMGGIAFVKIYLSIHTEEGEEEIPATITISAKNRIGAFS